MLSSYPLQHDDFVHDMAFDFTGKRIATASSDQKIRIWDKKAKVIGGGGGSSPSSSLD
jgi:WD40 repeat protein